MSDTPRTDRAARESIVSVHETSMQLERELAAAKDLAESNGKLAHDTAIRLACISTQRDEMLEALQSCFDVFVNQGWDDDLIAAKNAKAAIAKAKGEPS